MKKLLISCVLLLVTGCHRPDMPETLPQSGMETETETTPERIPETIPETEPISKLETEILPETEPIPEAGIRLLSGDENFSVSTVRIPGDFCMSWEYDEDRMLYMTYTPVRDETGKLLTYEDAYLYIVDLKNGTLGPSTPIDGKNLWNTYTDQVIYHFRIDEETGIPYADNPLYVGVSDTDIYFLSVTSTTSYPPVLEYNPYPRRENIIYSPCGRYSIYSKMDSMDGSGGMDLMYTSDLTTVRLFDNVLLDDTLPNGKKAGISDVRVYAPLGFVDDTRFVYRIGGWEWTVGYGIWDLMTGQYTETTGYGICGVHDGYLYLTENTSGQQYMVTDLYKAAPSGEMTRIASADQTDGIFWIENTEEYFSVPTYAAPYWITSESAEGNENQYAIWNMDLTEKLAAAEQNGRGDLYLREGQITCVILDDTIIP